MISTAQKFPTLSLLAFGFALATISYAAPVIEKQPAAAPDKDLAEPRHLVTELREKLEQQAAEIRNLQLRIEAGNRAGTELERQLDECLKHRRAGAELAEQLADAQALAKREHAALQQIRDQAIAREAKLKVAHEIEHQLGEKVQDLTVQRVQAELAADELRDELVREQIARKKLEVQLQASEVAAKQAVAAALAAAKAAADAKLLDIPPIRFGENRADSDAQEKALIAQVKAICEAFPDASFSISGHTCTDGNAAGNLALSNRRAQRIAAVLTRSGIDPAKIIEVQGYGQTRPIADNSTAKGRVANRRVEVKVLR